MHRLSELRDSLRRFVANGLLDDGPASLGVRVARGVMISPDGCGLAHNWQLEEDDFVLFPGGGEASMAKAGRRPSRDNRLHRAMLQAMPDWQYTWLGCPLGLLAFALAGRPLPLNHHFSRQMELPGMDELPFLSPDTRGPMHQAAALGALLQAHYTGQPVGAIVIPGEGILAGAVDTEKLIVLGVVLEKLAQAQFWHLQQPGS